MKGSSGDVPMKYKEEIVVNKSIYLRGGFLGSSVISGENKHRCMMINAPNVTIEGFTMNNGWILGYANNTYYGGGGLFIAGNNVKIVDCSIKNCSTSDKDWGDQFYGPGGGIYITSNVKNIELLNCKIIENKGADGGGIFIDRNTENIIISNCEIRGNRGEDGAGLFTHYTWSDVIISDCEIVNNNSPILDYCDGAGIYFQDFGRIENCLIKNNNSKGGAGGGIHIDCQVGVVVKSCEIRGNSSSAYDPDFNAKVGIGGGIYNSGATLKDCTVINNVAGEFGGGIYQENDGEIINCEVANNVCKRGDEDKDDSAGGGIYSDGYIEGCTIKNNVCKGIGGGVYCSYLLYNCIITDNSSGYHGGGIYTDAGKVDNCIINDNTSNEDGGGIYCDDGGIIDECSIADNKANKNGGGVYCKTSSIMQNSVINDNVAKNENGGGIYSDQSSTLNNCLIFNNKSSKNIGGGVYSGNINNCTITENTSKREGGGVANCNAYNSIIYFNKSKKTSYDNFDNNSTFNYSCTAPSPVGTGNLVWEPKFMDMENNNYHLQSTSLCIDSGNNDYVTENTDLDGNPRIFGTVDMGAYEYFRNAHYVSPRGSHSYPYRTWATAARDVQSAVNAANNGETVIISDDIHSSSEQINIEKGVHVIGVEGATIDGGGNHRCFFVNNENAVLDNLKIVNGNITNGNGGGVYLRNGTLKKCEIENNTSKEYAGGVFFDNGGKVIDCELKNNSAFFGGGAYFISNGNVEASIFKENIADANGGGFACEFGGVVDRCFVINNKTVRGDGGGGYLFQGGMVKNSILCENFAKRAGGGLVSAISGQVYNCTIVTNEALAGGGGIYSWRSADIKNSIVYHNKPDNLSNVGANIIYKFSCTLPKVTGEGNISGTPKLVNWKAGNYHLKSDSPCINAGKNEGWMTTTTDIDGDDRILGGKVDIGADEKQ